MNLRTRLTNKLDEIGSFLLQHPIKNNEIGALGGISGIALFHFYYANYSGDDSHTKKGNDIIFEVFNRIKEGYSYPTFCDGIAGACWVLELLKVKDFIQLEEDIITDQLDCLLFGKMKEDLEEGNYDFLHGALGYGYYFLKRYQNSNSLKNKYKNYLLVLIESLKKMAIRSDSGIWWESNIRVGERTFKGCNLGLSHGISSILNFLCRLGLYSDFYNEVCFLLLPISNHILSYKRKDEILLSSFPNWVTNENLNNYNSRLAWCYGDLGIGISLLRTGEVLKNNNLTLEALDILRKSTKRHDQWETSVVDAGLCHGAFGVMHIYKGLYKKTKDTLFEESANHWATIGINLAIHQDGYSGYKKRTGDIWELEDCLLDGISGIGLALLSYLDSNNKNWDELLLIS